MSNLTMILSRSFKTDAEICLPHLATDWLEVAKNMRIKVFLTCPKLTLMNNRPTCKFTLFTCFASLCANFCLFHYQYCFHFEIDYAKTHLIVS